MQSIVSTMSNVFKVFRDVLVVAVIVTATMLAMVVPASTIQAQGQTCLVGFTATDCEILQAARNDMSMRTSFDLAYDMSLTLGGLRGSSISLGLKGSGPVDLGRKPISDVSSLFDNLTMSSKSAVTISAGKRSQTSPFELRIVDGTAYVKILRDSDPSAGSANNQWFKLAVAKILTRYSVKADLSNIALLVRPGDFSLSVVGGVAGATHGERNDGPTLDNKSTMQYSVTFDLGEAYARLTTDAERQAFLQSFVDSFLASASIGAGPGYHSDLASNPELKMAAERVVQSTHMTVSWIVEPKAKILRGFGLTISTKIDAMIGDMINPVFNTGITAVDIKATFTISHPGRSVTVQAPPKALDVSDYLNPNRNAA
ncbi:MAG: hypothetical protein ABI947_27795 [Chloroflexota bacterium]